jgi:hypothetical protein
VVASPVAASWAHELIEYIWLPPACTGLIFDPEDGCDIFVRNSDLSPNCNELLTRRPYSSQSHLWELRIQTVCTVWESKTCEFDCWVSQTVPAFSSLTYFPYFEKIKVDLWDYNAACLCLCLSPISTFECLNQSLLNLVYISWHLSAFQRLIHKSHPPACVSVFVSPNVARRRLDKHVPAATNTRSNRRIVVRVVFFLRSMSYQRKIGY